MLSWHTLGISSMDDQTRYQALHHVFIASARVVQWCHANYPQKKIGMMFSMPISYPEDCNPKNVLNCLLYTSIMKQENSYDAANSLKAKIMEICK